VNLVAALTLPPLYYPLIVSLGVRFDSFGTVYFPPEAASARQLHLSSCKQPCFINLRLSLCSFSNVLCLLRLARRLMYHNVLEP